MNHPDWIDVRGQMLLDPTIVNLNAGSFGPLPLRVFNRISAYRQNLARAPMDFLLRQAPALLWDARERLASFLGGSAYRLIFTTNVTEAINLVASSLSLTAPGEILLTDHEYLPMRWCWERAAKRQGLDLKVLSLPTMPREPGEIIRAVVAAMSVRTRLFFFSHVLSSTGLILPVKALCEEARRRGIITVVDGAQAPAFTRLDLSEISSDFYAGSGHKWLLAPTGVGFLHLGAENEDRLKPMRVSWGHHPPSGCGPPDERNLFGSTPRLRRFECTGTRDICPWLAVPEAIDFQAMLGHDRIQARMRALAGHVRQRLAGRFKPATPESSTLSAAMTTFHLPKGTKVAKLRNGLWERFRVEVAIIDWPNQPMVRVSTHFYNTEADLDHLAEALEELVRL